MLAVAVQVRAATGHLLFEEQQLRVAPLVDAPDPDLITGSTQLIQRHAARIGLVQRILLQVHPLLCFAYNCLVIIQNNVQC